MLSKMLARPASQPNNVRPDPKSKSVMSAILQVGPAFSARLVSLVYLARSEQEDIAIVAKVY